MRMAQEVKRAIETLREARQLSAEANGKSAGRRLVPLGKKRRRRLAIPGMELDIVVLWGMYRGWSHGVTAATAHVSRNTVIRRRRFFFDNPAAIFWCPVLTRKAVGKELQFQCEFCGAALQVSERKARQHVALHVLSKEVALLNDLMEGW